MGGHSSGLSADKLGLYEKLVATVPAVERKGATIPYTACNGHMFSYLSKAGTLALRLPEDARATFLNKYKTTLCKQYGIVQKEYVEVPDEEILCIELFVRSHIEAKNNPKKSA